MATSVDSIPAAPDRARDATTSEDPPRYWDWVLYAVVLSSAFIVIGLIWDIAWHRTIGRDTLWSPPHVLEQIGASLAGLSCGALVLKTTFAGTAAERAASVRFWGFRGPLGAWVCIWGALAMIASVPFDDWWHNAYGLDVVIISPPHMVLLAGMIGIQVGAMLMALRAQNNALADARPGAAEKADGLRRYTWLFALAAGFMLTMGLVVVSSDTAFPNLYRSSTFYRWAALPVPFALMAAAFSLRVRWPATAVAAVYMAVMVAQLWILQAVPGEPLLGPIRRPLTRMSPLNFPLLIVAPALAIDVLVRRWRGRNGWLLAAVGALLFTAGMLAVHWPWAEFMVSPAADNFLFGDNRWTYMDPPADWQTEFWALDVGPDGAWSAAAFGRGLAIATLTAFLTGRVGIAFGRWMREVRR
jgi:hypothetical protein